MQPKRAPKHCWLPIRKVSEATGVNSVTLRAWERRYGLVSPQRSPSGHRMYTEQHINEVKTILSLLEQGNSFAAIKKKLDKGQGQLALQNNELSNLAAGLRFAISEFDEPSLESLYNKAISLFPMLTVINHTLLPLLRSLGTDWENGSGAVAEEHFFTSFLRKKLEAQLHHSMVNSDGSLIVAACLPNEHHDLGLLLFSLLAREQGFRTLMLGANTPLSELPRVASKSNACSIVLSATNPISADLLMQLRSFASEMSQPIFIGGHGAEPHAANLEQHNIRFLGCEFGSGMPEMVKALAQKREDPL